MHVQYMYSTNLETLCLRMPRLKGLNTITVGVVYIECVHGTLGGAGVCDSEEADESLMPQNHRHSGSHRVYNQVYTGLTQV